MEIKSITEAKKAIEQLQIRDEGYGMLATIAIDECHKIIEALEKSVREKANSEHNEHCWTNACLHDALKEVLGEEKNELL